MADVLVVGANGFIGSHLLARVRAVGHDVRALCRTQPMPGVPWARMDDVATNDQLAAALAGVSTVIWAAGASTPASTARRPADEVERNLVPLVRLLECTANDHPLRMVYLSTGGAIYGDIEGLARENMVVEPKGYYSAGKAAAEAFLSAWSHLGAHEVTILRPSNVYGPGQPYRPGFGIIPTAFHAIRHEGSVVVRGDGEAVRDYLYIDDLANLCERILARPRTPGCHTFNASSAQGTSLNELLSVVEEVTGHEVARRAEPATAFDVKRIVPDNHAATRAFGWHVATPLHEGVRRAWEAFR
ncbi:NAD-dependent epimerase/dehydratase family protein [Bacillus sp. NP157]|nr:NAD-dependent epimerase/dehydratase family protein [Bacillus sp. NP157]